MLRSILRILTLALLIALTGIVNSQAQVGQQRGRLVVDANGQIVGRLIGATWEGPNYWNGAYYGPSYITPDGFMPLPPATVEREIAGREWISFSATPQGIVADGGAPTPVLLYTSSDCSGIPYMPVASLPTAAFVPQTTGRFQADAMMYFPVPPFQTLPISSSRPGGENCETPSPISWLVGKVGSLHLVVALPLSIK